MSDILTLPTVVAFLNVSSRQALSTTGFVYHHEHPWRTITTEVATFTGRIGRRTGWQWTDRIRDVKVAEAASLGVSSAGLRLLDLFTFMELSDDMTFGQFHKASLAKLCAQNRIVTEFRKAWLATFSTVRFSIQIVFVEPELSGTWWREVSRRKRYYMVWKTDVLDTQAMYGVLSLDFHQDLSLAAFRSTQDLIRRSSSEYQWCGGKCTYTARFSQHGQAIKWARDDGCSWGSFFLWTQLDGFGDRPPQELFQTLGGSTSNLPRPPSPRPSVPHGTRPRSRGPRRPVQG